MLPTRATHTVWPLARTPGHYRWRMRRRRRHQPNNVFVLCTGRCGSVTFARACSHLTNYSVGHESRSGDIGDARMAYPNRHLEVDNRLSWFLGALDATHGQDALYVHLLRDAESVAQSFAARWGKGIIGAFNGGIVFPPRPSSERLAVCRFYVRTVTSNIETFLSDKPMKMTIWLEDALEDFPGFWERIQGEGNLEKGLDEFRVRHNATTARND